MFHHVVIDISDRCNALCKWCTTGRANRAGIPKAGFMEPERLAAALDHMRAKGIISPEAILFLYNWGEPFLHPKFPEIAEVIAERGHEYVVSTNMSLWPRLESPAALSRLRAINISMPGFSQASYDRIHGFPFQKIQRNILDMLETYRAAGFTGKVQIKYHVYQFNLDEGAALLRFAKENGVNLDPTFASFADLDLYMRYLEGNLDLLEERELSRELLLSKVVGGGHPLPAEYECPYWDALILNAKCEIVTCCMVTPQMEDFVIGSLFDIRPDDIVARKRLQPVCKRCMGLGIPELIAERSYPRFLNEMDVPLEAVPEDRPLVIWGTGPMAAQLAHRLQDAGRSDIRYIRDALSEPVATLPKQGFIHSGALVAQSPRPFVIVANEYAAQSLAWLREHGYVGGVDYLINSIVARA